MLAGVRFWWKASPLATCGDLHRFVDRRTAELSQKCTVGYCRARAGLHWTKLLDEEVFRHALAASQREAHGAVLARMLVMVEGKLRAFVPRGRLPDLLTTALTAVADAVLAGRRQDNTSPTDDDATVVERVRDALVEALTTAPRPAYLIARDAAATIFDSLPIHPSLRRHDLPLIENALGFNLSRAAADFERRADRTALVANLLASTVPDDATTRVPGPPARLAALP